MTEFALQRRCQRIFSGAFLPTDAGCANHMYIQSQKPIENIKKTRCVQWKRICVSAPAIYEWQKNDAVKDAAMPLPPNLK